MGAKEAELNAIERRRILTANDDDMQRRMRAWQNAYDAVRWLDQQEERFYRIDIKVVDLLKMDIGGFSLVKS